MVDARAPNARARASESSGGDEPFPFGEDEDEDEDEDDEMAALERRLRSMRTTRKERAEMEIAALLKQVREEMQAQVDTFEADAVARATRRRRSQPDWMRKPRLASRALRGRARRRAPGV